MSFKFKMLSLGLVYLGSLALGNLAHATCYEELDRSSTNLVGKFTDNGQAGIFVPLGMAFSSTIAPELGVPVTAAYGVSTSVDYATRLSDDQAYAFFVLYPHDSTTKASFMKLVKKEISKNKDAVIPTEEEIQASIDFVNENLIACRNEKNKFVRPTKASLLKVVIEDLTTK